MAKPRKRSDTIPSSPLAETSGAGADEQHATIGDDTRDRVAHRAYELYIARGGTHGGDVDDWIAAEREIAGSETPAGADRGE